MWNSSGNMSENNKQLNVCFSLISCSIVESHFDWCPTAHVLYNFDLLYTNSKTAYCKYWYVCIYCSVELGHLHLCQALSLTFDLDIQELRVNAEDQVTWQCPWCGPPGDQSHVLILDQWEVDNHGWVLYILETKIKQIRIISVFFYPIFTYFGVKKTSR